MQRVERQAGCLSNLSSSHICLVSGMASMNSQTLEQMLTALRVLQCDGKVIAGEQITSVVTK